MKVIAELTLPGVERSAWYARRFLRDSLVPQHLDEDDAQVDDMELVVDEFACNGIRHTASGHDGKMTIALLADPKVLRVEVTDEGAAGARPMLIGSPDGESGRGLHIVEALAERWGHRPDGDRTTVWAEFPR